MLDRIAGWVRSARSWLDRQRRRPVIRVAEDGFSVIHGDKPLSRVVFAAVEEIVAFTRDLGTVDLICLGFRTSDGVVCEVDEEMPGYPDLVGALARVFGIKSENWWFKVAFPAFAPNLQTIWRGR
jgi:hypothetical protein